MSDTLSASVWRTATDRRGGAIAVLVLAGLLGVLRSRRRARRRRQTALLASTTTYPATPASTWSVAGAGIDGAAAEFDRVEQERIAWPEPDTSLPDGIPPATPEADYLEQSQELPVDDDDQRAD